MNIEKHKAALSIHRTLFVFFGAIGSSIIGWLIVNTPSGNLFVFSLIGGIVFSVVSLSCLMIYFVEMRKL